eukprot:2953454-Rhodomonas_salina.3
MRSCTVGIALLAVQPQAYCGSIPFSTPVLTRELHSLLLIIVLRICYAMCGTDIGYAVPTRYAMCGTDKGYAVPRSESQRRPRPLSSGIHPDLPM